MSTLREFHHEAMHLADEAYAAERRGDHSEAIERFSEAFERDRQAAQFVANRYDAEPTRSMLYSSAASLAYQSGQYREAERMICSALTGNPPDDIANELRALLKKVNNEGHVELHGDLERSV
jgi:tetratricopeptide (TPR) repeat protein